MVKKLLLAFAAAFGGISLVQGASKSVNKIYTESPKEKQQRLANEPAGMSMDQMEQMKETQQFLNAFRVMLQVDLSTKVKKFLASCVNAYTKNGTLVEQKVIANVQKYMQEQYDQVAAEILTKMDADEETIIMVRQLKPLFEEMLIQEVMTWIHITAVSGVKI